ncbi:MAG: 3'-phosphoadenosine 5'-phosphosulfate sulfotransferase [Myxococcota bacterium]
MSPFLITGPALIALSGGRTSAKMLKAIIDAHGGTLPDDVYVYFANTGKERERTLRFVHECETRWGVHVHWLEWRCRLKRTPVGERFEEVGYNSAARSGEPFKALISSKKRVPNAVERWCTEHLKMQVAADFMEARGHTAWKNVVGLRADEMHRVFKKIAQNHEGKFCWTNVMPLASAKVRKADVRRFWFGQDKVDLTIPAAQLPQGFDLGLEEWEGNCTKCFMKGRKLLVWDVRRDPVDAQDWADMEALGGGQFVTEWTMDSLIREAQSSPLLPLEPQDIEFDAECGTWCAGEAA